MVSGSLVPWVLSIGGGIVTALSAVVGKLWVSLNEERAARAVERDQLRHELAEANDRIVELQTQSSQRSDEHQREHRRDLRRLAGLSTSVEPPAPNVWPPVVIRGEYARALPPAKKPR
jgi:TolA-binding protein